MNGSDGGITGDTEAEVEHSCFAIPKMFECFEKYLENEYPFDCCNFVFIDEFYSVGIHLRSPMMLQLNVIGKILPNFTNME